MPYFQDWEMDCAEGAWTAADSLLRHACTTKFVRRTERSEHNAVWVANWLLTNGALP